MIKAIVMGPREGRQTLFIGLNQGNLDRLQSAPMDNYILIKGDEVGLSHDVLIFHGKTEAEMMALLEQGIKPGVTKVHTSPRSKN